MCKGVWAKRRRGERCNRVTFNAAINIYCSNSGRFQAFVFSILLIHFPINWCAEREGLRNFTYIFIYNGHINCWTRIIQIIVCLSREDNNDQQTQRAECDGQKKKSILHICIWTICSALHNRLQSPEIAIICAQVDNG